MLAVDSIPAIYGITSEPFLVFTTNAFALMGLRQMFFLIDGLFDNARNDLLKNKISEQINSAANNLSTG